MPSPDGPRPSAVVARTLAETAAHLGVPVPRPDGQPGPGGRGLVTGVSLDSRAVRPGDLYAALPGARAHGADFAGQAAAAGAVAALTDPAGEDRVLAAGLAAFVVEDPRAVLGDLAAWVYGRPGEALLLIGVTGTNGKTTTAHLIEAGLRRAGHQTGLIGTVETRIGDEVVASIRTTPEATDLQALLATMRERGVDAVVMEVSSHALALGRVDGMVFDVAAFTNLGQDHLDFHADIEDYYAAKASLFTPARSRRAVVDVDGTYGARLAREAGVPVQRLSPGGDRGAEWWVEGVEPGSVGHAFVLHGPGGLCLRAGVRLPGRYNVANAALALAVAGVVGADVSLALRAVATLDVPGRMEQLVSAGSEAADLLAFVDYAHTPDAVEVALLALRPVTRGRIILVLGCGGDRDRGKRPMMGAVAARLADVVIVTDDNPRSEDPAVIRAAMVEGALGVPADERGEILEVTGRAAAIDAAVRTARPGDTLLLAGKGHEPGQEVRGVVHPFDDRVELHRALEAVVA